MGSVRNADESKVRAAVCLGLSRTLSARGFRVAEAPDRGTICGVLIFDELVVSVLVLRTKPTS